MCIHTYIHTYLHTYILAYIHTYIRTYIHKYILCIFGMNVYLCICVCNQYICVHTCVYIYMSHVYKNEWVHHVCLCTCLSTAALLGISEKIWEVMAGVHGTGLLSHLLKRTSSQRPSLADTKCTEQRTERYHILDSSLQHLAAINPKHTHPVVASQPAGGRSSGRRAPTNEVLAEPLLAPEHLNRCRKPHPRHF